MKKIFVILACICLTVGVMGTPTSTEPVKLKPEKMLVGTNGKFYSELESIDAYFVAYTHFHYATSDAARGDAVAEVLNDYGPIVPLPTSYLDRNLNTTVANYIDNKLSGNVLCGVHGAYCLSDFWSCMSHSTIFTGQQCFWDLDDCMGSFNCAPIPPSVNVSSIVSVMPALYVQPTITTWKGTYTVEDAIDLGYQSVYYAHGCGTDAGCIASAKSIIIGVPHPTSFNDPNLNSKIANYMIGKTTGGLMCGVTGAGCYNIFVHCVHECPGGEWCEYDWEQCRNSYELCMRGCTPAF